MNDDSILPPGAADASSPRVTLPALTLDDASDIARQVEQRMARIVLGQPDALRDVLVALLAQGHVLLEGAPGLGKTLLVRCLARCLDSHFSRVQFTPDLMPTDITGHAMYDPRNETFHIRRGPVFTNLLLADEINRAPAKTQAALLEVMQERQVTIEGEAFSLTPPFMVLATQNPIDQEGTYPLPEAELDRFLFKVVLDYPTRQAEVDIVGMMVSGTINTNLSVDSLTPVTDQQHWLAIQHLTRRITLDEQVIDYAVRLARTSRDFYGIARGASPRASIAMAQAGQAHALLEGRDFVIPDDIKRVAPAVLRHRIQLTADMEIEGVSAEQLLQRLLEQVDAPRQ